MVIYEYEKNHPEANVNQATQGFIDYLTKQIMHVEFYARTSQEICIEDGIDQRMKCQQIMRDAVLDKYQEQLRRNTDLRYGKNQ